MCPSFPSLLFSSSPSPLSFLDLVTAKGGVGRGDGLGFTNGMYSMRSMQPQCPFVQSSNGSKKLILAINFVYSHVESVFCPFFILSVTHRFHRLQPKGSCVCEIESGELNPQVGRHSIKFKVRFTFTLPDFWVSTIKLWKIYTRHERRPV